MSTRGRSFGVARSLLRVLRAAAASTDLYLEPIDRISQDFGRAFSGEGESQSVAASAPPREFALIVAHGVGEALDPIRE